MRNLNTDNLTKERQEEVLTRAKIEFRAIAIDNPGVKILLRLKRRILLRKVLNSKTLLEFMHERQRLHDEGIYFGALEEVLTRPYIELTKEELYSMGLDKERVDVCYDVNRETELGIQAIVGKDVFDKVHSYRK